MAYYHTYRGSKSLPRNKRPKSPATLVPFRSANPGQLEEFAVSTQLDFADESGVNTMANGPCQVSPFRTRTMKEYDQQISELKKENFSLKLRIYFLEEKMQQKFSNHDQEDAVFKANIELKVELENLKHELANKQELLLAASKALESLEAQHKTEIQSFKLKSESEQSSLKQKIDELEKENSAKHDELKRSSTEWLRKAFSLADATSSDNDNFEADGIISSLQLRIADLETEVTNLMREKETHQNQIKALESNLETKSNCIKIQEQNLLKRIRTIQGLLKKLQEKNKECDHLAKDLHLKTEELKQLKEEMNTSSKTENGSAHGKLLLGMKQQDEDSPSTVSDLQTTQPGVLKMKDDCCCSVDEQLSQLQTKVQLQEDICFQKDEVILGLQKSLLLAERKVETLSAQCNSAVEFESIVIKLKSELCDKNDVLQSIQEKFTLDIAEKSDELMKTVVELDKMKGLVKELEEHVRLNAENHESLTHLLSRSKDEALNLQTELNQRDDSIQCIKNFLENIMLGNMEMEQQPLINNEKVSILLQNLSKIGKLLQEAIVLSGKEVDNLCFENQQSPDVCVQLHHFDLIRDSHQQKGVVSLLSTNLHLKKIVDCLHSKLNESLKTNKCIQEQLNDAKLQITSMNEQIAAATDLATNKITSLDDNIVHCLNEVLMDNSDIVDSHKFSAELKNEMSKLKLQMLKIQQLNEVFQQHADMKQSCSSVNDKKHKELLISLIERFKQLQEDIKKLEDIEDCAIGGASFISEGSKESPVPDIEFHHHFSDSNLDEAKKEINRLRFLLSSTEGTVRMLSTRVKCYRNLLQEKGVLPLPSKKPSHLSDTNLMNKYVTEKEKALPSNIVFSEQINKCLCTRNEAVHHVLLRGSSSAPVTPIKGPSSAICSFIDGICPNHSENFQKEIRIQNHCSEQKDILLVTLQSDIERLQGHLNVCDVACQTVGVSLDSQPRNSVESDSQDGFIVKQIAESHCTSELLRIRLEELADFLERLLHFDENGLLDLSNLTVEKLASIREYLEKSQELSFTLSQSLMALDTTVMLSGTTSHDQALIVGPNSQSVISSPNEEGDGYKTLVSSPVGGLVNQCASGGTQTREPKSCSRSLMLDQSTSQEQGTNVDNYILLLRPLNASMKTKIDDSVAAINDELPTCSLTFGQQSSFLSSTNIGDALSKKTVEGQHHHSQSESDSWSEPDRGVSQQRIGLEVSQITPGSKLSPRRRDLLTSSSTDSEFINELGNSFTRMRSSKGMDKRLSNSQELSLLSQVQELKDINSSLRAELTLYQNLYSNKNTPGMRGSISTSAKMSRRGRTRSGDTSVSSAHADEKSSPHKLDDYLHEISALRKQLEGSIQAYDLLREQFERQLALGDSEHERNKDYEEVTRSLYVRLEENESRLSQKESEISRIKHEKESLLAEIQEMSEKFESYQETIESLQSMLEEQQRCSRDASKKVEHLESLLVERDAALEESNVAQEQLRQAMSKARQLLNENEGALKHLKEVNEELQNQCSQFNAELTRLQQSQEMVSSLNGHLEELQTDLETSRNTIDDQKRDLAILQKHVEDIEYELRIKEEEVNNLTRKIDVQSSTHEQDLLNHQRLVSKSQSEVTQLKAQLEAASTINKSFKTELQLYEKMNSTQSSEQSRDKNDMSAKAAPQLMSEIRRLRLQLERSIRTNQALRLQLEKKPKESLHLETGFSDQCFSSLSSPETASSFFYTQGNVTSEGQPGSGSAVERQISKSSDYVSDTQKDLHENARNCTSEMATDTASVYSSPDLGIESDRSRFSSLERSSVKSFSKIYNASQKVQYLEPGMPGSGYWNIVNSAPPKLDGGGQQTSATESERQHNFTYPRYGGNSQDVTGLSESGDSTLNFPTRKVYFIALQEDYGLLKKGIIESLNVLKVIRGKAKEHHLKLRHGSAVADRSGEYTGWKEAYAGCNALKVLLHESCQLIGQFWTIPLPLIPASLSESHNLSSNKEANSLEAELMRLYFELAKEKQRAEDALRKLEASDRLKAGMEKAIVKQLSKTHHVLKQAKGNLQQQVQVESSNTTQK